MSFTQEETSELKAILEGPHAEALSRIVLIRKLFPSNLMAKHFDFAYFRSLSAEQQTNLLKCCRSGIENPDSSMGMYAMHPTDYDAFKPYLSKVLAGYHRVAETAKHVNDWSLAGVKGLPENGVLNLTDLGLPALSMRVRVGRNLAAFPLPGAMSRQQRLDLEETMQAAFAQLIALPEYGGAYHSLTPGHAHQLSDAEYKQLVADHIMFKDMSADSYLSTAGIAADWPYGRGCYVSADKGFIVWVGEEDHLRIMCMKTGTVLNEVFDRLHTALGVVSKLVDFAISPDYGVVTSCPTNLGTGMRASVLLQIPKLTAGGSDAKAKAVCKPLGLSVRGMGGEHTPIGADGTCDISPSARFCITEAEIVTALYTGIRLLKAEEDKA